MNPPDASPLEEYRRRLAACRAVEAAEERTHVRLGNVRLATLVAAAVVAWMALGSRVLSLWWLAAPAVIFLILVVWHDRVLTRRRRAARAAAFYDQGIARLTDAWAGTGETGDRFLTADHPYAADLDLFGRGSLFELLTTARIRAGEERLAEWLLAPAAPDALRARQEAVGELQPRLALREDLAVLGQETGAGGRPDLLVRWGEGEPVVTSAWPQVAAAVLAALAVATLVLWASGRATAWPFVWVGVAELAYSLIVRRRVRRILAAVEGPARDLALLAGVFARFEQETFASSRLRQLRDTFEMEGEPPSARIATLQRLIDLLNSRQNQIFAPIAAVTLWGAQMAFAIERWRRRSGPHLAAWLDGIGDFEALCSLAGAPVRAARLRLSPLAIGATLRIQDSLQAGQSRFYAEITRVRAIVALTAGALPVLFLLDELLSGTNSHDRQLGAQSIVRGLIDRGGIGLVTTHDLALSAIVDTLAPHAANVHFADELDEGTLRFDYRMRPGIVRTSNALALMRAVGLDV